MNKNKSKNSIEFKDVKQIRDEIRVKIRAHVGSLEVKQAVLKETIKSVIPRLIEYKYTVLLNVTATLLPS